MRAWELNGGSCVGKVVATMGSAAHAKRDEQPDISWSGKTVGVLAHARTVAVWSGG